MACIYTGIIGNKEEIDFQLLNEIIIEIRADAPETIMDLMDYCTNFMDKSTKVSDRVGYWIFTKAKNSSELSEAEREAACFVGNFIFKQMEWQNE